MSTYRKNPFGSELLIVGGNPRRRRRKAVRRRKSNRGRKATRRSRRRNRGGGKYIAFSTRMWRQHRKTLMALPFKQRAKWISKKYKAS
jgi:hypothetical protein